MREVHKGSCRYECTGWSPPSVLLVHYQQEFISEVMADDTVTDLKQKIYQRLRTEDCPPERQAIWHQGSELTSGQSLLEAGVRHRGAPRCAYAKRATFGPTPPEAR